MVSLAAHITPSGLCTTPLVWAGVREHRMSRRVQKPRMYRLSGIYRSGSSSMGRLLLIALLCATFIVLLPACDSAPPTVVKVVQQARPTPTPAETATSVSSPTPIPTPTPVLTATPTASPTPTAVPASTGTATASRTPNPTPSPTATPTFTPTPTATATATSTPTPTPIPIITIEQGPGFRTKRRHPLVRQSTGPVSRGGSRVDRGHLGGRCGSRRKHRETALGPRWRPRRRVDAGSEQAVQQRAKDVGDHALRHSQ